LSAVILEGLSAIFSGGPDTDEMLSLSLAVIQLRKQRALNYFRPSAH